MEVKLINQSKTHIFECVSLTHELIEYKNREDLINIYNDKCGSVYDNSYSVGMHPSLWQEDGDGIGRGSAFLISMNTGGSGIEHIICRDCRVYITSKGQTIDILSI